MLISRSIARFHNTSGNLAVNDLIAYNYIIIFHFATHTVRHQVRNENVLQEKVPTSKDILL